MNNDIKTTHDSGVATHYTPAVEEFHVGFALELSVREARSPENFMKVMAKDRWEPIVLGDGSKYDQLLKGDLLRRKQFDPSVCRVKFLDRKDFDELYFRLDGVTSDYKIGRRCSRYIGFGKMDGVQIIHNPGTHHIMIIRYDIALVNFIEAKNKSRLCQILQWTGIIQES